MVNPDQPVACDVVITYHPATLRWVSSAIDSILNQQNAVCTVHVVADGVSIDDRRRIERAYEGVGNILFYVNEEAMGPYLSVHEVYSNCKTDYIAIQDSDDISLPHRIWFSVSQLKKNNAEIFGGAMENFIDWTVKNDPAATELIQRYGRVLSSGMRWKDCPSGWIANPTMVLRRSTFESLNGFADMFTGADIEFSERASAAGVKRHFSESIVVLRRLHGTNLSADSKMGTESRYFKKQSKQLIENYKQYDRGFDPKKYGVLHRHLSHKRKMQKFVIVSLPRSGSVHLSSSLNNHSQITCLGELFSEQFHVCNYHNLPDTICGLGTLREDPFGMLDRFWSYFSDENTVGFRIFDNQNNSVLSGLLEDSSVKKIILRRENMLRQFVSRQMANETGQWVLTAEDKKIVHRVRINTDMLLRYFKDTQRFYEYVDRKLNEVGGQVLRISYEGMMRSGFKESSEVIYQFLGVSPEQAQPSDFKRQNPEPLSFLIKNYDEVRRALINSEYAHLLHDDSVDADYTT